jgi:hypothetical protein
MLAKAATRDLVGYDVRAIRTRVVGGGFWRPSRKRFDPKCQKTFRALEWCKAVSISQLTASHWHTPIVTKAPFRRLAVARTSPIRFSTHGRALSGSIQGHGRVPFASRVSRSAMVRSGPIETRQKNAGRLANPVGNHRALVQLKFNRGLDQLLRHFEQLLGKRHQLVRRQPAMTLVHRLGERVGNPGANPNHGGLFNATMAKDRKPAKELSAFADQGMEQARNAVDTYFDYLKENGFIRALWRNRLR